MARGRTLSQLAAVLRGPVDAEALEAAFERALERHEILRTTIVTPAGVRAPQQVIQERLEPQWSRREIDGALPADADALAHLLACEAGAGLDCERGPLVRALLLTSAGENGVLVLT